MLVVKCIYVQSWQSKLIWSAGVTSSRLPQIELFPLYFDVLGLGEWFKIQTNCRDYAKNSCGPYEWMRKRRALFSWWLCGQCHSLIVMNATTFAREKNKETADWQLFWRHWQNNVEIVVLKASHSLPDTAISCGIFILQKQLMWQYYWRL